jgi:hypothetical protein
MILKHLCDWAMIGAFSDGALVTANGVEIDPFNVFMSRKACYSASDGVELDGYITHNPHWGPGLLSSVLLTESGIWAFCKQVNTPPQPSC